MNINHRLIACLTLLMITLGGCSYRSIPVDNGLDLSKVDWSDVKKWKTAETCEWYFLGFIGPFGDSGILESVKKARIKKLLTIEKKQGVYFVAQKSCIVVHGV